MTTTRTNNIAEMMETINEIRRIHYPDLPEELIVSIINLEDKYFDEREEVRSRIEKLVDAIVQQGN